MKRVDSKKDWEQVITIELPLKQLKLIRDSMCKVSYAELENLNSLQIKSQAEINEL